MDELMIRATLGALAAALLSAGAWRLGALSRGGAAAAFVVGWASCLAGWEFAGLLLVFFISGSLLSRLRARENAAVESIVEKGATRDAAQVLANGGVFAGASLLFVILPDDRFTLAAAGALAAVCADTWATEIGTRLGGSPRHVLTWNRVPAGTSGGVSAAGLAASIAGAALIAIPAAALGMAAALPVAFAGVAGALADTIIGATAQERRWCDACGSATERAVHVCGATTRRVGGVRSLNNDAVNLMASLTGALIAVC